MHVGNQKNSKNLWSEEQYFANNVLKEIKKAFTKLSDDFLSRITR